MPETRLTFATYEYGADYVDSLTAGGRYSRYLKKGEVRVFDVPGCGGRIELKYNGNKIQKVRCSCEEIYNSIETNLK